MTMTSRTARGIGLAVSAAATCAMLAACSSAGPAAPAASQSATFSTSPSQAASGPSTMSTLMTVPTALPVTQPVSKPIPTGLHVIYVSSGVPEALTYLDGLEAAGAVLGWNVTSMEFDPTNPATVDSAITSAIGEKPAAIVLDSLETQQFATEIPAAKAAHIPLFPIVSADGGQNGVYPVLRTNVKNTYAAKVLTDALLADAASSHQTANVLEITVPAFASVLGPEDAGVKSELAAKCPKCTQSILNVTLPDLTNGAYTQQVVSYLQSHPDINYIISDAGQLEDGLGAALQQAGLTNVKRYGFTPTNIQIEELRSGQPGAWIATPVQVNAWEVADEIARVMVGDATNLWNDEHLCLLITSANAKDVNASDPEFPADYQQQFKKLWNK
jgi:ribose transport system substrate-binding protein